MAAQERQEALDAVRRAMANQELPLASTDNPLGLPPNDDRQVPSLRVMALEGEERDMRNTQCANLADLQIMAIVRSADDVLLTAVVSKEVVLGHIAEFFRTRRRMGMQERMAPVQKEVGGPANTA